MLQSGFPGCFCTARLRIKESGIKITQQHKFKFSAKKIIEIDWSLCRDIEMSHKHFGIVSFLAMRKFFRVHGMVQLKCFDLATIVTSTHIFLLKNSRYFSANIWGWISQRRTRMWWITEEHLNLRNYINIFENVMKPSVENLYPDRDYIFQQDNLTIHFVIIVKNWLNQNEINVLQLPSKSPDFNTWATLTRYISKKEDGTYFRPQDKIKLVEAIENAWEIITTFYINNTAICSKIPQECIDNDGGHPHY